jgi:chemotaxis signal transduction protein
VHEVDRIIRVDWDKSEGARRRAVEQSELDHGDHRTRFRRWPSLVTILDVEQIMAAMPLARR